MFCFAFHTQTTANDMPCWGFSFLLDGRRIMFYHNYYMGWSDLSEKHNIRNCYDRAYCPWHGAL